MTVIKVKPKCPCEETDSGFKMFNWIALKKGVVKGLLITLNVFCILIAATTFAFAVVDTKILSQYGEEQGLGSYTGDLVIISVCVLLIGIAIFGIVGTVKDYVKVLYMYVVFLVVIVVLQLMTAILVSVQRYGLQYRVSEWLREDFFRNVTEFEKGQHDQLWETLQIRYECCGLNGPEDYAATWRPISLSCCSRAYKARTPTAQAHLYRVCLDTASYYMEGCEDEILEGLAEEADWLFGVAIISFWLEATGMILAMWVANHVKNSVAVYKETVKY